jgi:thymidylate synthase
MPLVISDVNLSHAWGKAFLEAMNPGAGKLQLLVVSVNSPDGGAVIEDVNMRQAIDAELFRLKGLSTETVATTIFPNSLWNPNADRQQLYERYLRVLPTLEKIDQRNRFGLYFGRMVAFDSNQCNQLEQVISTYKKGNHRPTALQVAIFDPNRDHSHQRRKGFPCLQQVAFTLTGDGGLAVTGFYGAQHLFERGYGNYLGLYNLGLFMSHELGLRLTQMNCVASVALAKGGDIRKSDLEDLKQIVKDTLQRLDN